MPTNFPTSLDTLTNPTGSDTQAAVDHAAQHANANDAIEALQAKVGINSSAVNTTHDYKLSGVATGDKAVSLTGIETLTNKTLTSPQINLGTNATGDTYFRNASGVFSRLPIGTSGQIYSVSSAGIPEWISNPAAADASTTEKGVVEKATTAEITAGTATGATGAQLFIGADAVGTTASKIVQLDSSARLPAVDGSQLTNLASPTLFKCGTSTYGGASSSGTQTIAHGMAKIPKYVRLTMMIPAITTNSNPLGTAIGMYNGTTSSVVYTNYNINSTGANDNTDVGTTFVMGTSTNNQSGTITFDATNIYIAWVKNGSGSGNDIKQMWEAFA